MWHHDVTNPRTCQFSAVCLTVFLFEFRPRTFTIGFYGKNSIISELMILECSFPLTSDLNWSSHVQSLVSMTSKRSGLLRLMSHQLPRAVTIRLFKSYIRPTREYASAVWHGSLKEEDARLIDRAHSSWCCSLFAKS